ncbi:hypothetical protein CDAR_72621 [Caerostris darwini]|uniref:Uncharacterized protein n=1 Tax=Caerostris darwini TaxID=1538125 RepID=A0AAV4MKP8_9ARAC|nr:hypothetical protein CDAR_72621 [Caerostris darwini]
MKVPGRICIGMKNLKAPKMAVFAKKASRIRKLSKKRRNPEARKLHGEERGQIARSVPIPGLFAATVVVRAWQPKTPARTHGPRDDGVALSRTHGEHSRTKEPFAAGLCLVFPTFEGKWF